MNKKKGDGASGSGEPSQVETERFKTDLVASRSRLRDSVVKETRRETRRQVHNLKDNRVVEGTNPNQIYFPEEIWLMIFDGLDTVSLKSCYNTCRLFRTYLGSNGNLILFRKVLPIIFQRNYLTQADLLKCRLVSSATCRWIDNFLESKDSWRPSSPSFLQNVNESAPPINFPFRYYLQPEVLTHARNPFIGRSVSIDLPPMFFIDRMALQEELPVNNDNRANQFAMMPAGRVLSSDHHLNMARESLQTCGQHIWYLSIKSRSDISERHVLLCLQNCQNLKRLEIAEVNFLSSAVGATVGDRIAELELPHLSSLTLTLPPRAQEWNTSFNRLQDALVREFSGQLKTLKLTYWNAQFDYCHLDWSQLKILQVDRSGDGETLRSLLTMKAKGLKSLSLILNGSNGTEGGNVELLLRVIHNFPKLEELLLQFGSDWKIWEHEVQLLPPTRRSLISKSLKRLHVRTGFSDQITYSFLLFFPHLENLRVSYCYDWMDTVVEGGWVALRGSKEYLGEEMYFNSLERRKSELLQLREYLYRNREDIYESLVWKILPFLQVIRITKYFKPRPRGNQAWKTEVFRRQKQEE